MKRQASRFTFYVLRLTSYVLRFTFYVLLLLLLLPSPAAAQPQTPTYWQYRASGRIQQLIAADMDDDGIDDFVAVDENGKVDILNANGALRHSYIAPGPILTLHTTNANDPLQSPQEIVLGLQNRLILLSATGVEIWQVPLVPLQTPTDLLVGGDQAAADDWLAQYEAIPVALDSLDWDGDGRHEILVLLNTGQLQLFSADGRLIWRYVRNSNPALETEPQLAVGDLDDDGRADIALGWFDPRLRFSQLVLINRNGRLQWEQEQPISGRITALDVVNHQGRPAIAVGSSLGQVSLYDADRQRILFRTINKPISALAPIPLENGPGLLIGTAVGSIIAYDGQGRRQWTRHLAPDADRPILSLSTAERLPLPNQPVIAAIIGPSNADSAADANPADVVLLSGNGRTLDTLNAVESLGPTRLVDINGDDNNELLLARFAQVELMGMGIGASEIAGDWEYDLLAPPSAYLIADFEGDGEDELLVGSEDGRIHRLNNNGTFPWVVNPGAVVTHLAALTNTVAKQPDIVVARSTAASPEGEIIAGTNVPESWLALRQANGEQIWEKTLPSPISSLQTANMNGRGRPEIIIGSENGRVAVFTADGAELWQVQLPARIERLLILEQAAFADPLIIAAAGNRLYRLESGAIPQLLAVFPKPVHAIYPFNQPGGDQVNLIVFIADKQVIGLNLQGRRLPQWPLTIDGPPLYTSVAAELPLEGLLPQDSETPDAFLFATADGHARRLVIENGQPRLSWLLTGLGDLTSLHWGDLNNDGAPDIALGEENGRVTLYDVAANTRQPQQTDQLNLGSRVFALNVLQRDNSQKSDLLAIAGNGVVQLFRVQENRPPLLTNPIVEAAPGRFSFSVAVNNVERDEVAVRLEIFDPDAQEWLAQDKQKITAERDTIRWLVDNPFTADEGVRYRFAYDDGFHQGAVMPPPGPMPIPLPALADSRQIGLIVLGALGLILTAVYLRQAQSPAVQARRFYRDLIQDPAATLLRLEGKYQGGGSAPDFLLSLANWARQRQDSHIAGLADGLFLMVNQPRAGLPIIIGALKEVRRYAHPPWKCLSRWEQTFTVGRGLLEAPSVTELSLLRPQLMQLLQHLDEVDYWSPELTELLPILTNLRDSKRVDLAEDSLVYLNKAAALLDEFWEEMPDKNVGVERPLTTAIVERWAGLAGAEIEELRGRADLAITLKTKRLIPTEQTQVALEIRNNGRAAAENLVAILADDPAYASNGRAQSIPLLPPSRARQITFAIEPKALDRFRLVLNLTYDDRNQRHKSISFGDMVHLLPPRRDFKPIANPYLPGTPLRPGSALFFGRNDLFDFIAASADRLTQRNVLILVGQRRTGKTSLLLRLDEHVPANLLPVYIDCQSLGVTPGMPALLYDLAWTIADALATRDIDLVVPETAVWQDDPTGFFQRQFLPQAQALLPEETTLLLVFDEFEAFENLVQDGILPPTLFPYLRHLMQHSNGLSFVFVGTRRLEEMSADYWSVLFNIALYQKIGYLEEDVAVRLIQEPVAPNLVYDDLAIDKILRVTAGHPYFLQLVCYTLVKRANSKRRSYVTISNVNAALDEMLSLGEMHFAYLWQRSSHAEKALLTAVSHLMDRDMSFHPSDMTQYLEPYGIHLTPGEITAALKSLVERDILQEITEGATAQYELKIGLVGLWVAKHKSLSHLYV